MAEAAANCWHHYWLGNVFAKPLRGEETILYSLMVGFFAREQACIERALFIFSPISPLYQIVPAENSDRNFYTLLQPILLLETFS